MKKTLKESMIDKKNDEKEGEKLRSIYNHYINKQDESKNLLNSELKKSLVILFQNILFHPNR